MIQGFNRKWRYLLLRDEGRRRSNEDILTAAVFGTFAYAEGELRAAILRTLCGSVIGRVDRVTLWPREYVAVEPDAIIDLSTRDGQRMRMIIETKWDSEFKADQALKQWRTCRLEGGVTKHLLIARFAGPASKHLADCDAIAESAEREAWEAARKVLTWREVRDQLRRTTQQPNVPQGVHYFFEDIQELLNGLGLRAFHGFGKLDASTLGLAARVLREQPFFWKIPLRTRLPLR